MSRPKRPVPSGPVPDLASWLREHPSGSSERLSLTRDEVHVLFQELQRLHQSTDRLRKQNRKIRKRFLAARDGGAIDDLDLDLDAEGEGEDGGSADDREEE
jgi:hypothetical protein